MDLGTASPVDLTCWLEVTARLGALSITWTEPDQSCSGGQTSMAELDAPPEAFQHAEAARYLTDLAVVAVAIDALGVERWRGAPTTASLAWPNGEAGRPEVWDQAMAESLAPQGVLDASLRVDGVDRVMPSLDMAVPYEPLVEEEEVTP